MHRDLILIASSLLVWGVGESMFLSFQTLYLQQWGISPVVIGSILGAAGLAMTVVHIPAGYLADRLGARSLMLAAWITALMATWLMALANTLPVFVIGLLIYSLTAFVIAPMNSYLTSIRGQLSVGRTLTISSAAFQSGAIIGPLLGGWIGEQYGLRSIFWISACVFIVSTGILFFVRPQSKQKSAHFEINQQPIRNRQFQLLLPIIFLTIFSAYFAQPLTPNFLQNERHLSLSAVGQLVALGSLGNVLISLFLGNLKAITGILIGQILVGLFSLIMWQTASSYWYALGYFLLGGYRLLRSMIIAYARPLIHSEETGLAYGIIEAVSGSTIIIAPIVAGFIFNRNPISVYSSAFIFIALTCIINLIALPFLKRSGLQSSLRVHQE